MFEQWQLSEKSVEEVRACLSHDDLTSIINDAEQFRNVRHYQCADVVSVSNTDSFLSVRRNHSLSEHTHTEDEVRLFLSGTVLVYLHINERIQILQCERGDFLTIPKGVKHWLDMGPEPSYSCIRWFSSVEGLQHKLTKNYIAESTPRWETILINKVQH